MVIVFFEKFENYKVTGIRQLQYWRRRAGVKGVWHSFPQESGGGSRKVESSERFFVVGVCALRSIQSLILLVGWQEVYLACRKTCHLSRKVLYQNNWKKKIWERPANPGSPGKWLLDRYVHMCQSYLSSLLLVRGHDGMSTPQNGAAAYSQSRISLRPCPVSKRLAKQKFSDWGFPVNSNEAEIFFA